MDCQGQTVEAGIKMCHTPVVDLMGTVGQMHCFHAIFSSDFDCQIDLLTLNVLFKVRTTCQFE